MKRFHAKEMLLVSAPLVIVALAVWGVKRREEAAKPRILECRVRPATPLEVSQGAQIGVTVDSESPVEPGWPCGEMRLDLVGQGFSSPQTQRAFKRAQVWNTGRSKTNGQIRSLKNAFGLRLSDLKVSSKSLECEATWHFSCAPWPDLKKRIQLDSSGFQLPNPASLRRANFRVNKVALEWPQTNGTLNKIQSLILSMEDLPVGAHDLLSNINVLGSWQWKKGFQAYPVRPTISQSGKGSTKWWFFPQIAVPSVLFPPPAGAHIQGIFAVDDGWPQEITIEWPQQFAPTGVTELKFSTRLAPLPAP